MIFGFLAFTVVLFWGIHEEGALEVILEDVLDHKRPASWWFDDGELVQHMVEWFGKNLLVGRSVSLRKRKTVSGNFRNFRACYLGCTEQTSGTSRDPHTPSRRYGREEARTSGGIIFRAVF